MRTVQMTLDEGLVKEVDRLAKKLKTTRSAFTRDALRLAIKRHRVVLLEQRHRQGYQAHPVAAQEFSAWETEHTRGE